MATNIMSEHSDKVQEFIESFIVEELEIQSARNRGVELDSDEPSPGTGAIPLHQAQRELRAQG